MDPITQKVFWGNFTASKIRVVDLDGSNPMDLIQTVDWPAAIDVDVDTGKIYWTENSGTIKRANLDGSTIETLHTGTSFSVGLVVDNENSIGVLKQIVQLCVRIWTVEM